MADWSSLPADLVNRIADRLLATDDLDYYMDLRAVCRGWRSSTDDPKDSPLHPRFQPRKWVMIIDRDSWLFVHPATGRFVRKDLPLLRRRYYFVAGAGVGWLVLAERSSPHAACLLNPFTGALIRFAAPVPCHVRLVTAHVVIGTGCSPPTLVLSGVFPDTIHWADLDSESFSSYEDDSHGAFPLVSHLLVAGIYATALEHGTVSSSLAPPEAIKFLTSLVSEQFTDDYFSSSRNRCRFLVESAGDILIVFKLPHRFEVFKIGDNMVVSIGRRRCLSVDADKFAAVDANSIYYMDSNAYDVRVYSLSDSTDLRCGGLIDSLYVSRPFSVVQLLSY